MKKKVYYKLNRYKVAKVEVESVEQEQAVKILNRETDRFAKSEDTYYENVLHSTRCMKKQVSSLRMIRRRRKNSSLKMNGKKPSSNS